MTGFFTPGRCREFELNKCLPSVPTIRCALEPFPLVSRKAPRRMWRDSSCELQAKACTSPATAGSGNSMGDARNTEVSGNSSRGGVLATGPIVSSSSARVCRVISRSRGIDTRNGSTFFSHEAGTSRVRVRWRSVAVRRSVFRFGISSFTHCKTGRELWLRGISFPSPAIADLRSPARIWMGV